MTTEERDSRTINLIKSYLIILIIFCHMNPHVTYPYESPIGFFSIQGIINAISIGISYTIGHVAVSVFFIISGFLFWRGNEAWGWRLYIKKIKRRTKTLLFPYITWNTLAIISFVILYIHQEDYTQLVSFLKDVFPQGFWNYNNWGLSNQNWFGQDIHSSGPFIVPLWYVRDLMITTLFSPLIYWLIKTVKKTFMLTLIFCYISKLWPQIPGFSIDAITFFSIGMYISTQGLGITEIIAKNRINLCILTIATFIPCIYYGSILTKVGRIIYPLFTIPCSLVIIYVFSILAEKYKAPKILINSSFFTYVLHACPIASFGSIMILSNKLIYKAVCLINGPWVLFYFISPFFSFFVCIIIYYIINNCLPRTCSILTGNRTNFYNQ